MNGLGKYNKIRQVMRLRQNVRKWRKLASAHKVAKYLCCKLVSSRSCLVSYVPDDDHFDVVAEKKSNKGHYLSLWAVPLDVPSGHLAVYVGQQACRRFVIRAAYLNHPVFRALLQQAEEEFGYAQQGGLVIPCDERLFEHILSLFSRNDHAAVSHLDSLKAIKNNFCNKWHCSVEPNRILLGNDSGPFCIPLQRDETDDAVSGLADNGQLLSYM